jgi:cysteine synthase A
MVRGAMKRGALGKDSVLIESSSGNLGIGLAQLCRYFGMRFICVVDPKTTAQNIQIMRAWGAQIDRVEQPDPATGDFLTARIARVKQLLAEIPNSFWSNQYANLDNAAAHHATMSEIVEAFDGEGPEYLICTVSSCGTLRGCGEFIRANGLRTKVIAVDAVGSIIFGGERKSRLIPGHGAGRVPELLDASFASEVVRVTDLDCVVGCRRLLHHEAILAGGSSGGAVSALARVIKRLPRGSRCVVVLCDRGERYLDTIYSDDWVRHHFGDFALEAARTPAFDSSAAGDDATVFVPQELGTT